MEFCSICNRWGCHAHVPTGYYSAGSYTTSITVQVDPIWAQWQNSTTITGNWVEGGITNRVRMTAMPQVAPVASPEEQRQADQLMAERVAERRAALDASVELLRSLLSPEQRAELEEHERFHVTTPAGHRYRIDCRRGHTGNVILLDDGGAIVAALCCHSSGGVPTYDHYAHQLLALMADEQSFVGTANVHRHWGEIPDWFATMRADWRSTRRHGHDQEGFDVYRNAA